MQTYDMMKNIREAGTTIISGFHSPIDVGRLLILSPFTEKAKRISSGKALERNRFIAAIGDSIFIPYAAPNSKTEQLCKELLIWNKPVYALLGVLNG